MLSRKTPSSRSIARFQYWVNGNCCLARGETDYLLRGRDLIGLATVKDNAIQQLVTWVGDRLMWVSRSLRMV